MATERIDKLLVTRGLVASRDRAQRLIMAGEVHVEGRRIDKAGTAVRVDAAIEVRGDDLPYVSRGGLKLAAALDHWQIEVTGRAAADIGASTGGFTDCMLQRGACRVLAIDVGYGQFAWSLRHDPRVELIERTNVRTWDPGVHAAQYDLAVVDVSFISLELVLPPVLALLRPGAHLLPLVKPQFEVGKGKVGKGGVVRDPELRQQAVDAVRHCASQLGLVDHGEFLCPVPGPKGNREFFLHLQTAAESV